MSFSTILFTEKGRALQSKVLAGTALNFTRIAMGSGSLGGQSQITLNALIEPKLSLNIADIKKQGSYATLSANFSNADVSTGFYWRELGIFAKDPDLGEILYCYGNAGTLAEYIPPQESEIIEKAVQVSVIIGDAVNISLVTDPAAFATKKEMQELSDNVTSHENNVANPHAVTKVQVGLGNVVNVATNDQTPTYTEASGNTPLKSGETLTAAFGKLAKAVNSLISHIADSTIHFTQTERSKLSGITADADKVTGSSTNGCIAINDKETAVYNHPVVSASDSITEETPGVGGKIAVIDSVKRDSQGHVTGINTKTVTLPIQTSVTGIVRAASKLATSRMISLTGDGTASASFDGTKDISMELSLSSSGIKEGTYNSITVDAKGRATAGSNPTTLAGYGITDAAPSSHVGEAGAAHGVATTSSNGFMSSKDKTKLDKVYIKDAASTMFGPFASGSLNGGRIAVTPVSITQANALGVPELDKQIYPMDWSTISFGQPDGVAVQIAVAPPNYPLGGATTYIRSNKSTSVSPWRRLLNNNDLVSTDQVNDSSKVPTSEVTYALGQEIDAIKSNITNIFVQDKMLGDLLNNPTSSTDIRSIIYQVPSGEYATNSSQFTNVVWPITLSSNGILITWHRTRIASNGLFYGTLMIRYLSEGTATYICSIFNNNQYTAWAQLSS